MDKSASFLAIFLNEQILLEHEDFKTHPLETIENEYDEGGIDAEWFESKTGFSFLKWSEDRVRGVILARESTFWKMEVGIIAFSTKSE